MIKKLKSLLFFALLLIVTFPSDPGLATAEDQPPPPAPFSAPAIQAKIDELQPRLKSFAEAETEQVAQALGVTLEQLRERTEILQETQAYYVQQLQALHKQDFLLKEKQTFQDKIASGEALKLEEEPPYSLKFYDDYNARYGDSKRNLDKAMLAVAVAENALQDMRERLTEAAVQVRSLQTAEGKGKNQSEKLQSQWLFQQAERGEALATAALGYQEQVLANAKVEAESATILADQARQLRERIREKLHFDQSDLDQQLAAIDETKKELQVIVDDSRRDLRQAGRGVLYAQRQLELAKGEADTSAAKAALAVAEQWQQTSRITLEQSESIMQQLGFRRQLWKQRYDLVKGIISRVDLLKLEEAAIKQRDSLQQRVLLEQERQTSLQLQIGKLEEQLQLEKLNWGAKSNLTDERQALMALVASTIDFQTALNKTGQVNLQFIEELERAQHTFSLEVVAAIVFAKVRGWWAAELFVVDGQALTVSKVIIALSILTFGILMSGLFTSLLQKRLLGSLRLSGSAAAITSKMIHYTVVLMVIFFAMRLVNIPLAAFTFMGGAIALGIGFGAQKLINNFISGFILMVEQPVKVGDLIMLADNPGWIEEIGARSTRLKTLANTIIMVPNSYFLENNIINWTHNDNVVRGQINVGVAYGSSTREVKEALLRAAAEHGEVHKEPRPCVWFADFADNAMLFELYFWVTVTEHVSIQLVASDLRFMVEEQFRANNIVIAFPQRDVHFDREVPLKVEISRPGKGDGAPPQEK